MEGYLTERDPLGTDPKSRHRLPCCPASAKTRQAFESNICRHRSVSESTSIADETASPYRRDAKELNRCLSGPVLNLPWETPSFTA
jgi:hypothetical protein